MREAGWLVGFLGASVCSPYVCGSSAQPAAQMPHRHTRGTGSEEWRGSALCGSGVLHQVAGAH